MFICNNQKTKTFSLQQEKNAIPSCSQEKRATAYAVSAAVGLLFFTVIQGR